MSLGRAIAGLAGGYVKGVQIKSDLDDAKERRGLTALQKQAAELDMDQKKQMAALNQQIGDTVMNFKPASMDDVDAFDSHYNQMEGLLVKQAALTGKDPLAVKTQMDGLRREKYAERVYAATRLLENGNDSGFEILKPVYNRLFKDGNMLMGGVYNKADDTYDIRYQGKDGTEKIRSVPREALVKQFLPMGLNTGDALKLALRDAEETEKRRWEEDQTDKDRTWKSGENQKDRDSRAGIARMQVEGEVRAAGVRRSNAGDDRALDRVERNFDDVRKGLPAAFGFDPKFATPEKRADVNLKVAAGMNIWRETQRQAGLSLSEFEVAEVIDGIASGKADVRPIPGRAGFYGVQVGSTRAVVPEGIIKPKQ